MADNGRDEVETSGKSGGAGTDGGVASPSHQVSHNFDFLNWFYWSMWWQQYSYWLWQFQSSPLPPPPSTTTTGTPAHSFPWLPAGGPRGGEGGGGEGGGGGGEVAGGPNYQQYWAQYQQQMQQQYNPAMAFPWQQGGVQQGVGQALHPNLLLRIRFITGFETFVAPLWRRVLAELIDMFLFGIILKFYFPDMDYRIPEVLFHGTEVWEQLDNNELLEIRDTALVFATSVALERFFHALMETLWVSVFACTPGKWLMGLRVWQCNSVQYTRTTPGLSIKVEPGGRLMLMRAIIRATFKATVSLFCPLLIFFIYLKKGRTKYDELTGSIVVDTYSLCREVLAGRTQPPGNIQPAPAR